MSFKHTVFLFALLVLSACQTTQDRVSQEHLNSLEKWKELAKYARDSLDQYDVLITTQPSLSKGRFVLTHFALSETEGFTKIDLLNPNFYHKYVCNPICRQLTEYIPISEDRGNTLLNEYFQHHEIDLFHLYGDLFHLNEKINSLKEVNNDRLNEYLVGLARSNQRFSSPTTFSKYLERKLSVEIYKRFLESPVTEIQDIEQKSQSEDWYASHVRYDGNTEMTNWSKSTTPNLETTNRTTEESLEGASWIEGTSIHDQHWASFQQASIKETLSMISAQWALAKEQELKVASIVCSYEDNLFGTVTEIDGAAVSVLVSGQAKRVIDGVILDLDSGALFSGDQTLSFLPLDHYQDFSENDLAICSIN